MSHGWRGNSNTAGFLDGTRCVMTVTACSGNGVGLASSSGNSCVAPTACPSGQGVRNDFCVAINRGDNRATKLAECQAAGRRILSRDTNSCRVSSMCDVGEFRNRAQDQCVTACAAGEGLSASSGVNRNCVAAGSTTAQQCRNASRVRLLAGNCATMCIANNAPANGQCGVATTVCTTAQGYNTSTRVCVASPNVSQCQALSRVLEGSACAAMCNANRAPDSGTCGAATTVCTTAQGYNTGTRLCVASPNAAQCQAVRRVRLSGGNCATMCGNNNAPTSATDRQCIAATTACTTAQGYNTSTRVCVASPNVSQCQALSRVLEGSSCAAMCNANRAPDSGTCGAATTVCTTAQGYNTGTRLCVASPNAAQCQAVRRVRLSGGNCATMCGNNNAPTSATDRQCIAATTACTTAQGYNRATRVCVSSPDETQCQAVRRVRLSSGNCALRCGRNNAPTSLTDRQCIAAATACTGTQGYNASTRVCVASPNQAQCRVLNRVRLVGGRCAALCTANTAPTSASNRQCIAAARACGGRQGYNSETRTCIAASSVDAGADCAVFTGGKNLFQSGMGCITQAACRSASMTAVNGNECLVASARTCVRDMGQGFTSGTGCVMADATSCSAAGITFDSDNSRCVVPPREISVSFGNTATGKEKEALNAWYGTSHATLSAAQNAHTPGTQNTNLATLRTSLAGTDADNSIKTATGYKNDGTEETSVTDAQLYQRSRYSYANQPSLDAVGAAFAYIRNDGTNSDGSNLGSRVINEDGDEKGVSISVITNNRFDPSHPSFTTAETDAKYDTIMRFLARLDGFDNKRDERRTSAGMFALFFGATDSTTEGTPNPQAKERVRSYVSTSNSTNMISNARGNAFFDIRIPTLTVSGSSVIVDTRTPRQVADSGVNEAALAAFINMLTGRTATAGSGQVQRGGAFNLFSSGQRIIGFGGNDFFGLTSSFTIDAFSPQYLGRRYTDEESNIDLYRLLVQPNVAIHAGNALPSAVTNAVVNVAGATDASMGLLALINGRRNLEGLSTFGDLKIATHGIAPEARLRVLSTPVVGNTNVSALDLIYRARDINVLEGTVSGTNVTLAVDMSRNIVLLQNTIAHASRVEAATQANINDVVGIGSATDIADDYKDIYNALKLGSADGIADTNMQDIYVFAAADGRTTHNDPGLLASLAGVQESGNRLIAEYSLIVTAFETAANAYCGTVVADFCITAPGSYVYRSKGSDSAYGGTDDGLTTITTATSNAAASLVAGGLAVLIDVFGDQITSKELVNRVIATADRSFTGYNVARHGQGMFNLEAASRPIIAVDMAIPVGNTATGKEKEALNTWYGSSHATLTAAQNAHTPGTQQTSLATLRTKLAGTDADNSIKSATGYKNDGSGFISLTDAELYQRSRYSYANQPSLDAVGAAFAYIRNDGATSDGSNLGGSVPISVLTNNRFDPSHPSFTTSETDAKYDSIARFVMQVGNFDSVRGTSGRGTTAGMFNLFFGATDSKTPATPNAEAEDHVRGYVGTSDSIAESRFFGTSFIDIRVPTLTVSGSAVNLDTLSAVALDGSDTNLNALVAVLSTLTPRTLANQTGISIEDFGALGNTMRNIGFDAEDFISLTPYSFPFVNGFAMTHLGRRYVDAESNIDLYRLFVAPGVIIHNTGLVLTAATDDIVNVAGATDASMGLLAMINGRRNLGGLSTFADLKIATHGIAPEARLKVFSTPVVGNTNTIATDLIYRARGINVLAATVTGETTVTINVDMSRNIVLLQNTIAHASRVEAATQAHINDVVGIGSATDIADDYKDIYNGIETG